MTRTNRFYLEISFNFQSKTLAYQFVNSDKIEPRSSSQVQQRRLSSQRIRISPRIWFLRSLRPKLQGLPMTSQ